MRLEHPNTTQLLGFQSPAAMSAAFNVMGIHFEKNGSDVTTIGMIVAPQVQYRLHIILTLSDGYAGGEKLDLALRYLDTDGSAVEITTGQLNAEDTPDARTYFDARDIERIEPGRVLQLVRDYTPGPGPKDTPMTLVLQFH